METYQVELRCKNCGRVNWISQIPKGTSVEEHVSELGGICKNCGVPLIKPKEEKENGKKRKGKE